MESKKNWRSSLRLIIQPPIVRMLFLGFSAGIPILLIFSSLSLWLGEAGLSKSSITFFSWAALGYSFKFVWAPLVDQLPVPLFKKLLGQRRSWLLLSQLAVVSAIVWMALIDPSLGDKQLVLMALAAVLLGFSSATQDIVIDAYRIESVRDMDIQALMSSAYIVGYRGGMIVAGAGALYLAAYFGTTKVNYQYEAWRSTYLVMACTMLVGIITTLMIKEPKHNKEESHSTEEYLRFLLLFLISAGGFVAVFFVSSDTVKFIKQILQVFSIDTPIISLLTETTRLVLAILVSTVIALFTLKTGLASEQMFNKAYVEPIHEFFKRYGITLATILLLLIGTYRISDIVLGAISNVFYQDIGFLKHEIASGVKVWGVIASILGGFLGGILAIRYGVLKILFAGAVLSAATNLLFMWQAYVGHNLVLFYLVISADNLAAGFASAGFIAFLSSLTNISFTAMQYALFSSLMTLLPKTLGGYAGTIVDGIGYPQFFLLTTLLGVPVLVLIWLAYRRELIANNS